MTSSISGTEKRSRGRPRTNATSIHLTLLPDDLAAIDGFRATEPDAPSRPEAIRRLIERGLMTLPLDVVARIWGEGD